MRPRILQRMECVAELVQEIAGLLLVHGDRLASLLARGIAAGRNRALLRRSGHASSRGIVVSGGVDSALCIFSGACIGRNQIDVLHVPRIDSLIAGGDRFGLLFRISALQREPFG